jgi:5-methylcytosine-specific restriction endonuclease McrA
MLYEIDPDADYAEFDEEIREYVCTRDDHLCVMCNAQGGEVHHIVFRSQGGTHAPNNLALLCNSCHRKQHSADPLTVKCLLDKVKKNEKRFRKNLV